MNQDHIFCSLDLFDFNAGQTTNGQLKYPFPYFVAFDAKQKIV